MWNPNIKAINITTVVQTILTLDLDILSMLAIPMWYNIDCSQLIPQLDCYQLQLVFMTMEHHPARNLQHETCTNHF